MANDTHSTQIPESQKVRLVDERLNHPPCPIPTKLALFDKLVEGGTIKQKEAADNCIPSNHKEKIKNASFNEREEYWTNKAPNKSYDERMAEWRQSLDAFLDEYNNDSTKKVEKIFLKKLLVCAAALGMCDRTSKSLSHPRSRGE